MNDIWVVFDIDGVITDGTILTDGISSINKRVNLKDIDAIHELARNSIKIAAITAEKDMFSAWVESKFPWNEFFAGVTDKGSTLSLLRRKYNIPVGNLYYIGDGKKDISAFYEADISICPADAIENIRNIADVVLTGNAGSGALWELVHIVYNRVQGHAVFETTNKSTDANIKKLWKEKLNIHRAVLDLMERDDVSKTVCESAEMICNAIRKGYKLILFGNGGSAADAQHIAAEFVGRFNIDRTAWNAIALTTNTSIITAVANDFSYDYVFSRQISAIVAEGDVVIGISTSGCSRNVLEGLKVAHKAGAHTIILTGEKYRDDIADISVNIPATYTSCIQEMHIIIGHFWADYVERENS